MSDTKTRGRKPIEVTAEQLQEQIITLEKAQPDGKYPNRSALWLALEATEWAKGRSPRPLTAQVAMNIAKSGNLTFVTPVGKCGREKGQGPVNVGPRKPRKVNNEYLNSMLASFPEDYHKVVKKAAGGSLKAVIKLKCLDCCGCEKGAANTHSAKKEVSLCVATDCANWGFRPYKHKESLTVEGRKRISLGLLDAKENDDEQPTDSNGTVV